MKLLLALRKLFTPYNAVHIAISDGHVEEALRLINLSTKLNVYYVGFTPLQFSLYHKQPECTFLLLEKGADPNLSYKIDNLTRKTIQPFVDSNNSSVVKLLALYGATPHDVIFHRRNEDLEQLIWEKHAIYQKRKRLEGECLTQQDNVPELIKIYTELSQLWEKQQDGEPELIYRRYYQNKVELYKQKILALQKLSTESKSSDALLTPTLKEQDSIPLLSQPPPNLSSNKDSPKFKLF